MADKVNLTEERIRAILPPESGEYVLWDSKLTGFHVRCFPSGRKVYNLVYRKAGSGRNGKKRRMTLGAVDTVKLADARSAAQGFLGQVAGGGDPQEDRKALARRAAARLDHALGAYHESLKRRKIVHADQIVRQLRRYMPGPLDQIDLGSLDRQTIAQRIAKIEKQQVVIETEQRKSAKKSDGGGESRVSRVKRKVGGVGAAADFRTKAHTFFSWAVSQGLIYANPLAGWRRERTTRAQRVERRGRALSTDEIKAVWNACDEVAAPYGDYIRTLMLTGQRRTETALMRRIDLDLDVGTWTIPAHVAKNGRQHVVPLPDEAVQILSRQERFVGNPYVFAGGNVGSHMSNYSRRQEQLVLQSGVSFTLHDLRRTFRSGLRQLGTDTEIAEMMLNHTRSELIEIYDREPRMAERRTAACQWAEHVTSLSGPPEPEPVADEPKQGAEIIHLNRARA